jgi:peptidoglycan/xylan/chitin deacetylase (PgdA/CDA1 family)
VRPSNGRIEIEVSGEVPAVELSGPTDAVLRVGGATIGRVRLPRTSGTMGAQELRAFLTGVSGFELCRAAVREGILGQPLDAPGTLRERLTAAAGRRAGSGMVDLRGVVLARHPRAPLASPSSRRAFLPPEALPELLDLAIATGQAVVRPPEGPAPRWAEYAPDLFAEPAALGPGGSCAAPPSPVYGRRHFEALFAAGADPWKYTNPYEETKYEQTLSLLPDGPIGQALELACAEGHFTLRLAPRVERLVAADISQIALERTAGRCGGLANVELRQLDLTRDPLPGGFDLVVCSEVLYFAGDVPTLQQVARRLAGALAPGGHLLTAHARLVADEPEGPGFDWDFPFGSRTIGEALGSAGLRMIRELRTPLYRIQLFRREGGLSGLFHRRTPPQIEEAETGPLPPEIARHALWNGGRPRRSEAPPDLRTWRLPILLYHRIAPEGAAATARYRVAPEAFAEQLRYLRDAGYYTPRLCDWLRALESKEPLPGRAVLITFDDGMHDFADHAWRLLREHGFSALVFLVADAVGGTNRWDDAYGERLPLLGWDEIRRLRADGIEFGSHTATHRPLTALPAAEAVRELARSRAILTRELGAPPDAIAYPHGATDPVVQHLTAACGYLAGLTCAPKRSGFDDPPLALPRLEVRGDASFADFVALLERE